MLMQPIERHNEDNVIRADFRADAPPRKEQATLIERVTLSLSQQGDRFFWEILDWQGQPMLSCTEVGHKDGHASFNAAWMTAVGHGSRIAERANTEFQRYGSEG